MASCKKCGSSQHVKNGIVGGRQRYKCLECGCNFRDGDAIALLQNCLPVTDAIAVSREIEYLALENQSVQNCRGDYRIAKKISPFVKTLV